ncbi:STAS domain-containing protein [Streptomyces chilikensis]|uniref:STAS domain-containing protein n=1 Tax=Streptomyces chilikensis TaxID=1194079 RepID=UPI000B2B95C5|nr:STAS domain-containing protein [Streptomyces chilikensis]
MLTVRMQGENTAVVRLPQQVDYDNASVVGAECEELVRRGCTTLVVDASLMEYLDSSGISMLIMVSRTADAHAGTLRLAAFNDHYQQIWHMLGLETLLPLSPTVGAALSAPGADEPAEALEASDHA